MCSLLPRTKRLHRNAPMPRGLKATSLQSEGIHKHRTSPSPRRGEGRGEGRVLATALPTPFVGAHPVRDHGARPSPRYTVIAESSPRRPSAETFRISAVAHWVRSY